MKLARLLIIADQIGYIALMGGERQRLWRIVGGNQLDEALLYGFRLTPTGDSPIGRAWLKRRFDQVGGVFRFEIT